MPTIKGYIKKSFSLAMLIAVLILALAGISSVVIYLLPSNVQSGVVLSSFYFIKEIGLALALLILSFLGYKAFKVIKTEGAPSQEFIKMTPAIAIWFVIILSVAIFTANNGDEIDCQRYNYNKELNGGVKEFNGTKYTISLCGSGVNNSHFFGDGMEKVLLTVVNEQGEVLAKRYYKVFWDGQPGHEPLQVKQDSITYQDDEKQEEHTIVMPPTLLEGIRTMFPFLN